MKVNSLIGEFCLREILFAGVFCQDLKITTKKNNWQINVRYMFFRKTAQTLQTIRKDFKVRAVASQSYGVLKAYCKGTR